MTKREKVPVVYIPRGLVFRWSCCLPRVRAFRLTRLRLRPSPPPRPHFRTGIQNAIHCLFRTDHRSLPQRSRLFAYEVMSSSSSPRQEMVQSAVSFLSDPKVHSSSVAQRIAFLESKGLSSQEIDEALRQVGLGGGGGGEANRGPANYSQQRSPYAAVQQPYPPYAQQAGASRDWRDWFIMAVVSGAVGYGVIALARVSRGPPVFSHDTEPSLTQSMSVTSCDLSEISLPPPATAQPDYP